MKIPIPTKDVNISMDVHRKKVALLEKILDYNSMKNFAIEDAFYLQKEYKARQKVRARFFGFKG